jgi:hypothetical protein
MMKTVSVALLATCFCLITRAAGAASQPTNPLPPDGNWTAVFQPQEFTRVTFHLPNGWATSESTEIELRLEPLMATRTLGMGGPLGVVSATVKYDPSSGAFSLVPAATARRILGADVPVFTGVYDRAHGVIGGKINGRVDNPWFVLAPDKVAQRAFLATLESAAQRRSSGGVLGVIGGKFGVGGKNQDKLRNWAQQFLNEFPESDPYRTTTGQIQLKIRNLFQDQSFKPYFGKTFDELSVSELGGYQQTIQQMPAPRSNFPEERVNGVLKTVEHSFVASLPSPRMASGITLSVLSMRAVDGWRTTTLQQLKMAEPVAASWLFFQSAEATATDVLADDWPNRRDAFSAAIAAARTKTASPLFEAGIGEFLKSAEAENPARVRDTLATLSNQKASTHNRQPASGLTLAVLASNASPEVRDAQITKLTTALSSASKTRCTSDRTAVRALPAGLAGLDAVNVKYREMTALYTTLPDGVAGCAAFADLSEVRTALLVESESELAARIVRASNSGDVNAIASRYLSSSLQGGAAGARLLAAADKRNEELRAAQAAALEKEKQRIAALCGLNTNDLTYAADVQLICAGEFGNVGFGRDSEESAALVSGYLGAFAQNCKAALPANKVEITEQHCVREAWTESGGWEVAGSRHCVQYETVGTGQYADPEVLNLADQLQQKQFGALMGDFFGNLAQALQDPLGFTAGKVRPVINGRNDMMRLLSVNGCASKPTKQFQRNLLNFGSGRAGGAQ